MSEPYSDYAEVYDRIGQSWFGRTAALETLSWLTARGDTPETAFDLCCGTGAATLVLAEHGIAVIGLDRSAAMLAVAERKAIDADREVQWIQGDVRQLEVSEPVDLVTCFYDSLNYILDDGELGDVFRRVRSGLREQGWFAFDLNTEVKLELDWIGTFVAADDPDLFVIYDSHFDAVTETAPMRIVGFRHLDGAWHRFQEQHVERAYPLRRIYELLIEAGFNQAFSYAFFDRPPHLGPPATEEHRRWMIFASPQLPGRLQ